MSRRGNERFPGRANLGAAKTKQKPKTKNIKKHNKMAKNGTVDKETIISDSITNASADTVIAPRGWDLSAMADIGDKSCDGWYSPLIGREFYGTIVGGFTRESDNPKKPPQVVVKVELATPLRCVAAEGYKGDIIEMKDDEGKTQPVSLLKPGQIIGVTLRAKINNLQHYEDGTKVHVKATGKKSIGGGQTMWEFDVHATGKKKPVVLTSPVTGDNSSRPLPF